MGQLSTRSIDVREELLVDRNTPALEPAPRPVQAAAQRTKEAFKKSVFVRDRNGLQRVECNSITMLNADGNYVEIHTADRRFVLRTSLSDVVQQLCDSRFVRVNRQTAVNVDHITRVDYDSLMMGAKCITLSRNYRADLLAHLHVLGGR